MKFFIGAAFVALVRSDCCVMRSLSNDNSNDWKFVSTDGFTNTQLPVSFTYISTDVDYIPTPNTTCQSNVGSSLTTFNCTIDYTDSSTEHFIFRPHTDPEANATMYLNGKECLQKGWCSSFTNPPPTKPFVYDDPNFIELGALGKIPVKVFWPVLITFLVCIIGFSIVAYVRYRRQKKGVNDGDEEASATTTGGNLTTASGSAVRSSKPVTKEVRPCSGNIPKTFQSERKPRSSLPDVDDDDKPLGEAQKERRKAHRKTLTTRIEAKELRGPAHVNAMASPHAVKVGAKNKPRPSTPRKTLE